MGNCSCKRKKRDELSCELYETASSDTPITPDIQKPLIWPVELDKRAKEHGERRFNVLGIGREDTEKIKNLRLSNFKFYDAPAVIFIFMDKSLGEWSIMDIGMFAQTIMISALEYGLGTCPQAALTDYPDKDALINTYRSIRAEMDEFVKWF